MHRLRAVHPIVGRPGAAGLTFVGRGFDVRIGVPFDRSMDEALGKVAAQCVAACPVGAGDEGKRLNRMVFLASTFMLAITGTRIFHVSFPKPAQRNLAGRAVVCGIAAVLGIAVMLQRPGVVPERRARRADESRLQLGWRLQIGEAQSREDEAEVLRLAAETRRLLGDQAGVPEVADEFRPVPPDVPKLTAGEAAGVLSPT